MCKMMGAVQPFISGAISKTINMPTDADVEDICTPTWSRGSWVSRRWRSIATAPSAPSRSTPARTKTRAEANAAAWKARKRGCFARRLPDERRSITHKFDIAGHEGYITAGMYEDGQPGEIFITMSKEGSTISGLMDSFATAISMRCNTVSFRVLVDKFSHMRFEPSGFTKNP